MGPRPWTLAWCSFRSTCPDHRVHSFTQQPLCCRAEGGEAPAGEPLPSSLCRLFLLLGLFKMVLGSLPCFAGLGAGKSYWSKWTL